MSRAWILAVALVAGGAACEHEHSHGEEIPEEYQGLQNPYEVSDQTAVAAGATLYAANCAACHGDSLRGDGPDAAQFDPAPSDLIAHIGHHDDDYLLWRISDGVGMGMPAWADKLTLAERWQIITYVRSVAAGQNG